MDPPTKRIKRDSSYEFAEENRSPNRVLLVDGIQFAVQTDVLVAHSDYFRAMLTSDFIEKNKEEIELKQLEADEVKLFLDAVFKPSSVEVSSLEEVNRLLNIFDYFQAQSYLCKFLGTKSVVGNFPKELLRLAAHRGLNELKIAVDDQLAAKFASTQENQDPLFYSCDLEFEADVLGPLNLATEFSLTNLLATVDAHLSSVYKTYEDGKLIELLPNHCLVKLTRAIEEEALFLLTEYYHYEYVEELCLSVPGKVEMKELKKIFHEHWLAEYNDEREMATFYLAKCKKYRMANLKYIIEQDYIDDLKSRNNQRGVFAEWMRFKVEIAEEQMDWREMLRGRRLKSIEMYAENAIKYGLYQFKLALDEFFLDEINNTAENEKMAASILCLEFAVEKLPKVEAMLVELLVKKFSDTSILYPKGIIELLLGSLNRYRFRQLEDSLAIYLLVALKRINDNKEYLSEADFCKFAFVNSLPYLRKQLDLFYLTKFECKEIDVAACAKLCTAYNLPNLKEVLEAILNREFKESLSFEHAPVAFCCEMETFKETINEFIESADIDDDIMKTGQQFITKCPFDARIRWMEAIHKRTGRDVEDVAAFLDTYWGSS